MRKIQVAIYYNSKKGFLFFPFGIIDNGPRVIIEPAIKKNISTSMQEIGDAISQSLVHSRNSLPVKQADFNGNLVLEVSGIKGHTRFNNIYKCILCEQQSDHYFILNTETKETIQIALDSKPERLGEAIMQLLSGEVVKRDDRVCSFTTLYDSIVSYTRPSDDFVDRGDGGTDAYQIYAYEENDKSYMAFLMDNGYTELTEKTIRKRWGQMYGELLEFKHKTVNEGPLKILIKARTADKLITSNIYQDGDGFFEMVTEIDTKSISSKKQKSIEEEFKKVIESIKITSG